MRDYVKDTISSFLGAEASESNGEETSRLKLRMSPSWSRIDVHAAGMRRKMLMCDSRYLFSTYCIANVISFKSRRQTL